MCSACSGDYEDPDMTTWDEDELEACPHTDLVQWNASLGKFVCPICSGGNHESEAERSVSNSAD